jgi:hypothetical protein
METFGQPNMLGQETGTINKFKKAIIIRRTVEPH